MGGGGQGELGCRRGRAPGVPMPACLCDTSPAARSHAAHFGLREAGGTRSLGYVAVWEGAKSRMQMDGSGRERSEEEPERRRNRCPISSAPCVRAALVKPHVQDRFYWRILPDKLIKPFGI